MVAFILDLCSFSPNGLYLAGVIQTDKRILVRNCDNNTRSHHKILSGKHNCSNESDTGNRFKVEHKFSLELNTSPISEISWSPDSLFIGASCKKWSVLSIHSLVDKNWKCKVSFGRLEEGGVGLERFWWGRDARHLLCLSEECMYLTVWSIRRNSTNYIKNIAKIREHGQSFSPDGSHLAVAHVDETYKFYVGIYNCKTWRKERSFYVASKDLAGISWSPSASSTDSMKMGNEETFIACWDSPLFSNLYIYNAQSGQLVKHYSPYGMATGFDSVQWSTPAHFLVCTSHGRNEIHVLNGLTFGVLIHDVLEPTYMNSVTMTMPKDDANYKTIIFSEVIGNNKSGLSKYREVTEWPTLDEKSPTTLYRLEQKYFWNRAAHLKLNSSGSYLACMTQLYPRVLWIYHLFLARLAAVLIHENSVLDFDWNPNSPKLAIICSSSKPDKCSGQIYFWAGGEGFSSKSSAFIRSVQIAPSKLSNRSSLKWSPQGDLLTVRDHNTNKLHVFSNF